MKTFQKGHQIICRLEIGDEILTELKNLAATFPNQLGTIAGIGACNEVIVSVYSPASDQYIATASQAQVELLALSGNVENANGTISIHLHASFARLDTSVFGGHLKRAVISRTGEIIVSLIPVSVGRVIHTATQLRILDI